MAFEIKCTLLWSDPIGGVSLVRVTQADLHAGDLRLLNASVPFVMDTLSRNIPSDANAAGESNSTSTKDKP